MIKNGLEILINQSYNLDSFRVENDIQVGNEIIKYFDDIVSEI